MHICCESLNQMYFFNSLHHCSSMPCPKSRTGLIYIYVLTIYRLLQKSHLIPSSVFPIHPSSLDPRRCHLNSPPPHSAGVPLNCHLGMELVESLLPVSQMGVIREHVSLKFGAATVRSMTHLGVSNAGQSFGSSLELMCFTGQLSYPDHLYAGHITCLLLELNPCVS